MKKYNESQFVEDKELRGKYLEKINVLEKVKEIITLPNTMLLTTKQVASYYEVNEEVIRDNIRRNAEELIENGMSFQMYTEIKSLFGSEKISRPTIKEYGINVSGKTNIFTKRALLNIGMLLRDSEVAKRVRSALLDLEEIATEEQKVKGIDDEENLIMKIIRSDSIEEMAVNIREYKLFKEKPIKMLQEQLDGYKPIIEDHEQYMNSNKAQQMLEVAKAIDMMGRNDLFEFLRKEKVLMKSESRWNLPYQKYIDAGYFTVVEKPIRNGETVSQTLVYPRGVQFIARLLRSADKRDKAKNKVEV